MKKFDFSMGKFKLFLYTLLIPILAVCVGHIPKDMVADHIIRQVLAQAVVFILLIPYINAKRDYFKISPHIVMVMAVIFFAEFLLYILAAFDHGLSVVCIIPALPIMEILSIIAFAPIIEEIYFRGLLQDCLNVLSPSTMKFTPFISSGLFALAHVAYYGRPVIFLVFCIGYISTILLNKYKNMYPSIAFHAIYNCTCVFLRAIGMG